MHAPFVWVFVCFALGIVSAFHLQVAVWLVAASFAVAIASLQSKSFAVAFAAQSIFLALICNQMVAYQDREYENDLRRWVKEHEMETVRIVGFVRATPEISRDFFALNLDLQLIGAKSMNGVARLTVSGQAQDYPLTGDLIETYARLRLPRNFRAEGSFNYERYLRKERIHALGTVKSASLLHKIGHRNSLRSVTSQLRLRLIQKIIGSCDPRDAGMLRALWLDDRSGLVQDLQQTLIDAGVFHVIAISGFHVAVVIAILFFGLRRFLRYRTALVIVSLILLFYFLLLEGRSSIARSLLTFLIIAFAVWRHEHSTWSNILFLSALIQLVINPLELFDSGYHLTYLSTGAILFIAVPICKNIRLPRKIYRYAADFVITALSIQFVLIPYQAFVFHRIPMASLLANMIAIPLSSILIGVGLFALPAMSPHGILVILLHKVLAIFVSSSSFFSGMWLKIVPTPSWWMLLAFYGSLIATILFLNWKVRAVFITICAMTVFLIFLPPCNPQKDFLRVHFIDIGQGDAILLEYPDGTYDLVDSGGFFNADALDTGLSILIPYLSCMKVQKLHRIFLTHAHADHMNGFITLLKYVPVEEFYISRKPVGEANFQRLLVKTPLSPRSICRGKTFQQGEVKLEILMPIDTGLTSRVANDDSLVMLLAYRGKHLLLTGDMEAVTESALTQENLMVDYIKIPHHGSKTSSSEPFLETIRPHAGFISVGANNWFGHPAPEVMTRLKQKHMMIYRTDEIGTITLTLDGNSEVIDAYNWRNWR